MKQNSTKSHFNRNYKSGAVLNELFCNANILYFPDILNKFINKTVIFHFIFAFVLYTLPNS
nr:MAG TPA: hypothetical protein [Caudoviricetes sp.]